MDREIANDKEVRRRVVYSAMCALVDKTFDEWFSGYLRAGTVYCSREMQYATDLHSYISLWLSHGGIPFDPRVETNEVKLVRFVNEFSKE